MKFLLLIGCIAAAPSVSGQNYLLPDVKQGKWRLIDTTGKLVATTPYSYIGTYDNKGFTYFQSNGAYGILNSEGKEVVGPVYEDVQQLGNGKYMLKNSSGWLRFQSDYRQAFGMADTLESYEILNDSWAIAGRKDSLYLINQHTEKRWKLRDTSISIRQIHDHILLEYNSDSLRYLLDGWGNELFSGRFRFVYQNEAYHFYLGKRHYLFDARGSWNISGITGVSFRSEGVFVATGTTGTLYDYSRRKLVSGNFDNIQFFDEAYFIGYTMGWATLISRSSGARILPLKYNDIQSGSEGGYFVYKNGLTGTLDAGFREVVPCLYERFVQKGDLIFSYDGRYQGLYSLKTRKEILPAVYDYIRQTGQRFKAYRSDLLTLIEINERHEVVNKASIDNTFAISLRSGRAGASSRRTFDSRLFSLGWFLDSTIMTAKDSSTFYTYKWGLADRSDSILIRPSIPNLVYIPSSPFTMNMLGNQSTKTDVGKRITATSFKAVSHETGKTINSLAIVDFDSTDFRNRDFMRVSAFDHFAILRRDGTFQKAAYVERGSNRYLRYCEAEKVEITEKGQPDMTEVASLYFRNTGFLNIIAENNPAKNIAGLTYPKGSWNFFDETGHPLFKDTFSFAYPFLGQQAIVRKGRAWGVVSADTLIIAPVYSQITRRIIADDTLFIAKRGLSGMRLLDTNAQVSGESTIIGVSGTNLLLEEKGQRRIVNEQQQTILEGHSSYKFLENGLILAKNRKIYSVYDREGTLLFDCKDLPEQVISEQFIVMKAGGGLLLCNNGMETVLDHLSFIERRGDFILAKKGGKTTVYDLSLRALRGKITGTVLADTISRQFAVVSDKAVAVYSADGKRTAHFKGITPDVFIGGRFIVRKGDSSGVFSSEGVRLLMLPKIKETEVFPNGAVFLRSGRNYLFGKDWQPVLPEEQKFRNLSWCGENVYSFRSANGKLVLYNAGNRSMDSSCAAVSGLFHHERLLVKKNGGYTYLDLQLKPVTHSLYNNAQPFYGNFAAVGDKRGWTIIDLSGKPLSYPNFGPVTPVHRSLFKTEKLALNGLFDATGRQLIPVEYEQLNFLPHNIVQAIKNGEVSYFRTDGTPLFK